MVDQASREPARDPQDLERLLVSRQRMGDIDGMLALFDPHVVIDSGDGRLTTGREAIRAFYAELVATGRKFEFGDQRPAIISGDLALTSTRLPDGSVTSEVGSDKTTGHGYGSSTSTPLRSAPPQQAVPIVKNSN